MELLLRLVLVFAIGEKIFEDRDWVVLGVTIWKGLSSNSGEGIKSAGETAEDEAVVNVPDEEEKLSSMPSSLRSIRAESEKLSELASESLEDEEEEEKAANESARLEDEDDCDILRFLFKVSKA